MAVPQGVNAQYYQTGRGLGLYQGAQPLAVEPPIGTPAWWQNEGIKDAVNGWPSKTGIETPRTQTTGQPYSAPGQQYPAPNPGVVRLPSWVDDYWSGYLWALQDPGTAAQRVTESNWTSDYKRGLSDGLVRRAPSDPRGLVPTAAQLALIPAGIAALIGSGASAGTGGVRTPPVYVPRPGTTGGVYVPPPPLPPPTAPPTAPPTPTATVQATFEIYGARRGRPVSMRDALTFDGRAYHLKNGYQILVGLRSSDGFGLGGRPGSWPEIYPSTSPAAYGLDADKGVVAMDGRTPRAVPASDLAEIFGSSWRMQVYGVGVPSPPAPAVYFPDGTLLKSNLHPEVFVMEFGLKHWVADATVFQNHGYTYAAIQYVDQGVLDSISTGAPLTV